MATARKETTPATAKGPTFKRKAQLTYPVLKKKDDEPIFVRVLEPIFTGKEVKVKQGEQQMAPAQIMRVENLETGELQEVICNSVLESTLNETFPDQAYVGKCFEIVQHAKKEGKRYKTYSIWELDCPN